MVETEANEVSKGEIEAGGGFHFFFRTPPSYKPIHLELMLQQENNGAANLNVILRIVPPLFTLL